MKPQRAWGRCRAAGVDGGTILYDVFIDWESMRRLARKAAKNKSGKSRIGPVQVVTTSTFLEVLKTNRAKVEQLSNNEQTGGKP